VVLFALLLASRHLSRLGALINTQIFDRILDPASIPLYLLYHNWGFQLPQLYSLIAVWLTSAVVLQWAWSHYASGRNIAVIGRLNDLIRANHVSFTTLVLAAPLVAFLLAYNQKVGAEGTSGEAREYYKLQDWARTSTSSDAAFIIADSSIYDGWRTLTRRPRIAIHPICAFYVCSKAALSYDKKLAEFHARHRNVGYMNLDTDGLKEFALIFGGDYAVRRKAWAPLDFPIVFSNESYIVYDLRGAARHASK
jgi:hypothetical protein